MWGYLLLLLFYFLLFLLVVSFFCVIGCFWFIILVYFIFVIMSPFIKSSFSGLLLFIYWFFFRSHIPFLRDKLKFLVDAFFNFIIFFCLGSPRATLLSLNNLFFVFLFMGFVCLILYLFIDKIAVFQPFYFAVFLWRIFG